MWRTPEQRVLVRCAYAPSRKDRAATSDGGEPSRARGAPRSARAAPVHQHRRGRVPEAEEEPDGRAIQFGLYDGETLVGFVMLSDEVGNPSYVAHFLWKLLIDGRFQRHGTARLRSIWSPSTSAPAAWTRCGPARARATAARSRSTSAPGSSVRARPRGARSCSASICRCGSHVIRGIRLLRSAYSAVMISTFRTASASSSLSCSASLGCRSTPCFVGPV